MKTEPHACSIYVLFDENGKVNYVGRTRRPIKLRMYEHRSDLGFSPAFKIVATCSENCNQVEREWIDYFRERGHVLRNLAYGQGPHFLSAEARAKLAVLSARPKAPEVGRKIAQAQRERWAAMGASERDEMRVKFRNASKKIDPAKRSAIGRKSAIEGWNKWTPQERAIINAKISRTARANPEANRSAGRKSIEMKRAKNPNFMDDLRGGVQRFWSDLRKDPVRLAEYLAKRGQAISIGKLAAFAKKRANSNLNVC